MSHVYKSFDGKVLEDVCNLMKKNVCKNAFPSERPTSASESMEEFVVVSLPLMSREKLVCQKTPLRIEIFVRQKSTGIENTKRISELMDKVFALFPYVSSDRRFSLVDPYRTSLTGKDGLGFYVRCIQSTAIINTTDSYTIK